MTLPKIAVIIPAKDASSTIKKCLDSILGLDYSDYEVIVVDDGSEDVTPKILENYKDKIKVIATKGIGPSAARNLAAQETTADYIAFTDSDCIADKSWLKELTEGFKKYPEAVACGGVQKLPEDATDFEEKVFLFMKKAGFISDYMRKAKDDKMIEVKHNPSCCVLYRRDIFLKAGGFLEGLWPGEDVELDYRLKKKGCQLIFNPRAIVYHYRPSDLNRFCRMMYRYGLVQGFLVRKYGIFRRVHFEPILLIALLGTVIYFSLSRLSFFVYSAVFLALAVVFCFFLGTFDFRKTIQLFSLFCLTVIFWNLGFFRGLFLRLKQG